MVKPHLGLYAVLWVSVMPWTWWLGGLGCEGLVWAETGWGQSALQLSRTPFTPLPASLIISARI